MADCGNIPQVARIICPYFDMISMEYRMIVCEGMVSGAKSAMVFRRREDMEKYSSKYCESYKYGHCPLARQVGLKIIARDEKAGR